jgi:hypothetical protein
VAVIATQTDHNQTGELLLEIMGILNAGDSACVNLPAGLAESMVNRLRIALSRARIAAREDGRALDHFRLRTVIGRHQNIQGQRRESITLSKIKSPRDRLRDKVSVGVMQHAIPR